MAVSDVAGVTCRPLPVVVEGDAGKLIEAILVTAGEYEVEVIVVGLPRPLSGGTNDQMQDVLSFVSKLRDESKIRVETWDERFTSRLAEAGRRGSDEARDSVAACYMLQNYLDRLSAESRG